jgi:hypothetical protein
MTRPEDRKPPVNVRRFWLAVLAGWAVWVLWSSLVTVAALGPRYEAAWASGLLLESPRVPFFLLLWTLILFILSLTLTWLYLSLRVTRGPGPRTAATLGIVVGFATAVPGHFAAGSWLPIDRAFPLWWMLELWVGALLASLAGAWVYRD